jgi:hypothetical protein
VARRSSQLAEIKLPEFSGGLNLRDAPTELALNESPDLWNVTIDERGGIVKRLGMTKWNASAAATCSRTATTAGSRTSCSGTRRRREAVLRPRHRGPDAPAHVDDRLPICICDFAGKVYAVHPVDGLYSSTDGVTWTLVTRRVGVGAEG